MEANLRRLSRKRSSGPEDSLTWSLQALLIRHESYIADAEAERARMSHHIASLESSNQGLEARNTSLQEENNILRDQSEDVNKAVEEAEGHVKSLEATLQSTRRELNRVSRITKRTEDLESQLLDCERQQAELHATLNKSVEEERATNQKWRASERRIVDLERELYSIEQEARRERDQHEDTVMRLERRKAVEEELQSQDTSITLQNGHQRQNSEVVSSFVKEILQDNANMQIAMSELREMLAYYKDAQQSPMDLEPVQTAKRNVSLGDELGLTEQQKQELHVHHHYHAPQQRERSKPPLTARPKRRRPALMSGRSSGRSTPNYFASDHDRPSYRHQSASSQSSVLSSESRQPRSNRWSMQSAQTQSSVGLSDISSPQSTSYCPSTIFERPFSNDGTEYSQTTTPDWSPVIRPKAVKCSSDEDVFQPLSLPTHTSIDSAFEASQETIVPYLPPPTKLSPERATSRSPSPKPRQPLRRTNSHASLLSISGMDIHTTFEAASPAFFSPARQHSGAILTTATASAMSRSIGTEHVANLRGRLAPVPEAAGERYIPLTDTFGNFKKMGGWLSGRWGGGSNADLKARAKDNSVIAPGVLHNDPGVAGAINVASADTTAISSGTSALTGDKTSEARTPKPISRPPGINQLGGLPPLPQPKRAWMRGKLDEEALKECLDES